MARSLAITTASTLTTSIDADAYVKQSKPDRTYGLVDTVNVSGTDDPRKGYLRFTIASVSGSITHAVLRLYVDDNGTKDGPALYGTSTNWSETTITWNTAPPAGALIDDKGALPKNTWVEYDITALVAGGNGTYSVLLLGQGGDSVDFSARQGSHPPEVVLTIATNTPHTQTKYTRRKHADQLRRPTHRPTLRHRRRPIRRPTRRPTRRRRPIRRRRRIRQRIRQRQPTHRRRPTHRLPRQPVHRYVLRLCALPSISRGALSQTAVLQTPKSSAGTSRYRMISSASTFSIPAS